jgi:superfamily II DNA helicase RecQ
MPGSVEAYYQEIGRAGRDGLPARAVLLFGYVDRRTHEFFLDRDYPDSGRLQRIYNELSERWQSKEQLLGRAGIDPDDLDRALESCGSTAGPVSTPKRTSGEARIDGAVPTRRRGDTSGPSST